ncbi:aspartate carbamoyltransferase regulatory subunit [Methanopyrus kandleri]
MVALKVKRIEMGTVLDHLPPGTAPQIMRILDIDPTETTLLVAINVESSKMGRKDILKIEGKILSEEEANKVALVAPNATVNIVRDYSVAEKFQVKPPERVEGFLRCPNPNCITNDEREPVDTVFVRESREPLEYRCRYCERTVREDQIRELIRPS